MSDKKRITALMIKYLSIMLAVMAVLSLFAFPAAAADEEHTDAAIVRTTNYDLTELPDIIKQFRKGTFEYDTNTSDIPFSYAEPKLQVLSDNNCIILPKFTDTENLKKGDIRINFDDIPGEMDISVNSGGYRFTMSYFYGEGNISSAKIFNAEESEGRTVLTRTINGIEVTGIKSEGYLYEIHAGGYKIYTSAPDFSHLSVDSSDAKIVNKTRIDSCRFYYELPDGFYMLAFSGTDRFETIFDNFGLTVYPLTNGFVRANGRTYYNKDGEFLKGWYKIGGKLYYFDKDGTMATGTVTINKRKYRFGEDGEYIG
jgi:hypothetical protein